MSCSPVSLHEIPNDPEGSDVLARSLAVKGVIVSVRSCAVHDFLQTFTLGPYLAGKFIHPVHVCVQGGTFGLELEL